MTRTKPDKLASHGTQQQPQGPCPCGTGRPYAACCAPYHAEPFAEAPPAPTAEALMRSRYSAYVLGLEPYLLATWHPTTRPAALGLADEPPAQWLGLEVKRHSPDGETAEVAFVARYKMGGRAHRLVETSRFVREGGRWFYVNGNGPGTTS